MFHQWSNSLLFPGHLFWFPVMNGQNNLRRMGYSETWNIVLITSDGTCEKCFTSVQYTSNSRKRWLSIYLDRYWLYGKKVLKMMFSKLTKGIVKDLKHLPLAVNHWSLAESDYFIVAHLLGTRGQHGEHSWVAMNSLTYTYVNMYMYL